MAILDALPGIEVTVLVDGEVLTEYDAKNDVTTHKDLAVATQQQTRTVTKYIESTTSKSFFVILNVKAPFNLDCPNLRFGVYVDGQRVAAPFMNKSLYSGNKWSYDIEGIIQKLGNRANVMAMKFSELKTTEEPIDTATLKKHSKETYLVGEILIRIGRCSRGKKIAFKGATFGELDIAKKYHEKVLAKDGKSHGITLGTKKAAKVPRCIDAKSLDGEDFPIGIFRFKYRSAHALQTLQILPRADLPGNFNEEAVAESQEDELGDLDPAVVERVKRMLARGSGRIKSEPGIKRDHSDSEEDVKPSKKTKLAKKKKQIGKTTVDLTEDSDDEVAVVSLD